MTPALTTGRLNAVALVIIAILAGAYLLGGGERSPTSDTANASATTRPSQANPDLDRPPARPPLPPEKGGPYGSRRTTGGRHVALTFDDGPHPRYTPQTLALLRRHRVKATFCLVGVNVRAYPHLVRAIVAEGHTLCNHSWNHDLRLGSRSTATIRANLVRTSNAIRAAATGARVAYYRQPGGRWTSRVVAIARGLGMTSLHWKVDPQDWRKPGAARIAARVTAGTAAGAIVLLHDAGGDRRGTVSALNSILPNLARRFQLLALPIDAPP